MLRITDEIARLGKAARIRAYLDVIVRANQERLQEAYKMGGRTMTFDQVMESVGATARWEAKGEAKGEARKAIEIAQNMLKSGFSVEQTASLSGLGMEKTQALANA